MDHQIRLLIYRRKSIYDKIIVMPELNCQYDKVDSFEVIEYPEINSNCDFIQRKKLLPVQLRRKGFNAYLISLYIYTMNRSIVYRKFAVHVLRNIIEVDRQLNLLNSVILIKLRTPKYQFIDHNWNERLTQMVNERQEIDHAMSWLSTLGGAFSALGDQFDHCAKVAGKISVEQFKLAMRLGDPQLVARCELYASLSLLQQGYLKIAKNMVKKIYMFAVKDKDVRLQKMCQGVWAKLKYCHSQRKKLK